MTIDALARELEQLKKSGIVRTRGGATEREVREAEAALGVTFPSLYRSLVRRYGVIDIYDRGVFGVGPAAKRKRGLSSVLFHTDYARGSIDLPSRYIVLWHESHGDVWCLDTTTSSKKCPVWHLDPEVRRGGQITPVLAAPNLIVWLRHVVEKQLRSKELSDREFPGVYTPMGKFRTRKGKAKFLAKLRAREAATAARAKRMARRAS